jgi:hypothetical protein
MVMSIGLYSCLMWRMCISYADWGFLEVIYLIFSLHFSLDSSLFDLYKRVDRSGIVIGRCHCAFMCWYCLFEFWVYHKLYNLCGMCFGYHYSWKVLYFFLSLDCITWNLSIVCCWKAYCCVKVVRMVFELFVYWSLRILCRGSH